MNLIWYKLLVFRSSLILNNYKTLRYYSASFFYTPYIEGIYDIRLSRLYGIQFMLKDKNYALGICWNMILMMMIILQYNNCQASRHRMERYCRSLYLIPLKTLYAYENYTHSHFCRQVNNPSSDMILLFYRRNTIWLTYLLITMFFVFHNKKKSCIRLEFT